MGSTSDVTKFGDRHTLGERIRRAMPELSPSERRIARHILSGTALSNGETTAALAAGAGVSAPTVLRCLDKLGFPSYATFRDAFKHEAEERRDSALAQMGRRPPGTGSTPLKRRVQTGLLTVIEETFARVDAEELERALDLLADTSRKLAFTGGRFSQSLAEQLCGHADLIRPGCELVAAGTRSRLYRAMDFGRSHVVTIFDLRRYQRDSVEFAREAKRRRAKLILVTDPWMSPIADWAEVVLVADVHSPSPFDTQVPALALAETLIAGLYERLGSEAAKRLAGFEALNEDFEWTAT